MAVGAVLTIDVTKLGTVDVKALVAEIVHRKFSKSYWKRYQRRGHRPSQAPQPYTGEG